MPSRCASLAPHVGRPARVGQPRRPVDEEQRASRRRGRSGGRRTRASSHRMCSASSSSEYSCSTSTSFVRPSHARVQCSFAQHRQNGKSGSPGLEHLVERPVEQPPAARTSSGSSRTRWMPCSRASVGLRGARLGDAQVVEPEVGRERGAGSGRGTAAAPGRRSSTR